MLNSEIKFFIFCYFPPPDMDDTWIDRFIFSFLLGSDFLKNYSVLFKTSYEIHK